MFDYIVNISCKQSDEQYLIFEYSLLQYFSSEAFHTYLNKKFNKSFYV